MQHRAIALAIVLLHGGVSLCAQTVQTIPMVAVTPMSREMAPGKSVDLEVKLVNSMREPVVADKDFHLRVSTSGASVDRDLIVIRKGQTRAHFNMKRDAPGISYVNVEPVEVSSALAATGIQVAFSPKSDYKPLLPLSLSLIISPGPKMKAGDVARLTGLIVDRARVPVPASRDYDISFPGLSDLIMPYPMHIKTGSSGGEAFLTSQGPGTRPFTPTVNPPISIVSNATEVDFDSPIVGVRIIGDPSYIKAVSRHTVKVKVGLIDVHRNWIASDGDRTVILRVEPPDGGKLGTSEITILKGTSTSETQFTPYKEGLATITAQTEQGLIIQTAQIEFHYAFSFFLMIAAVGGIGGGFVREMLQTGKRPLVSYLCSMAVGAILGILAYVLAPALLSVSFKPEALLNASKPFEAFLWGFVGGGSGAALFGRVLPSGSQQPASPVPSQGSANPRTASH